MGDIDSRKSALPLLLFIISLLALTPSSLVSTMATTKNAIAPVSARTTLIPMTLTACALDQVALSNYAGQISNLQTQVQNLQQQLAQQPQNSVNTVNYVNKALVSVAAELQQVVNSMTTFGDKMMAASDSSTKGIELYNAGFALVGWANDLQKNDNFQQVTITLNFASLDASQQDWQDVIGNLQAANQALTGDIQAISKDQNGIGRVYGYVLNNQLDSSGGSNPNGPLTQLLGFHHSLDPPLSDLENLSSGEISIDVSQATNALSALAQIQTIRGKLSALQNNYNQMKAKAAKDCV